MYMSDVSVTVTIYFFFNDTATTEIYTLSLHDALPICAVFGRFSSVVMSLLQAGLMCGRSCSPTSSASSWSGTTSRHASARRSEEHTSELQSRQYLVCRLLLEKKKNLHNSFRSEAPSSA